MTSCSARMRNAHRPCVGLPTATIEAIKAYRPAPTASAPVRYCTAAYETDKAKLVVREMTDLLVLDLVDMGLVTDQMVLTVGYDIENLTDPAPTGKVSRRSRERPLRSGRFPNRRMGLSTSTITHPLREKIMCAVSELFDRIVDRIFLSAVCML